MLRILVADDDPIMVKLFKAAFGFEDDIHADVVGSGFDELPESYDWQRCDIALLDQYLGPVLGSDMFAWIKDNYPQIRRVMLTGDLGVSKEGANADLVLYKPIAPAELMAVLRSLV